MNRSKTLRSAWSQSFKAVPPQHPPAHQSSRAHRSISCWTPRCSWAVKVTLSTTILGGISLTELNFVRAEALTVRGREPL